ncbi:Thioesterase/thiol ester dehydrase-isomerase [Xylariaceae sp. FL0804]|nr:Thioesterase/thiol ester dehydrase-isomerase [Xylariaceae sp. FL0804]
MACRTASVRRLLASPVRLDAMPAPIPTPTPTTGRGLLLQPLLRRRAPAARGLHGTTARRTDGVFSGLSHGDSRLPTPWIEALRRREEEEESRGRDGAEKDEKTDNDKQQAGEGQQQQQQRDMTPRRMGDSYHRVVLPLARDPWLSDTYINASGHIRLGAIFMDLDALSGIIVYKHTGPGVTTVTAALDRITIAHPLTEICDLEYSGQVTYASGRSSMEITCRVARARGEGEPSHPEDVLLTCTFTMVALDPATHKPTRVPELTRSTPEEEAVFREGEARARDKKAELKTSLLETEPDDAESALIHRIWLRQLAYRDPHDALTQPANVVPMASTQLSTASIMQPQYRNRHQTMIFGGFHLKQTFELAFCCAASFAHARPAFVSADPCTFRSPVPVGSVLYLTATVVYTDPPLLEVDGGGDHNHNPDHSSSSRGGGGQQQCKEEKEEPQQQQQHQSNSSSRPPLTRLHVRVDSRVRDVEHGAARPTGQFHYTFAVPRDVRVLPHSYQEYMMYVDARRRVRAARREADEADEAGQGQEKQLRERVVRGDNVTE